MRIVLFIENRNDGAEAVEWTLREMLGSAGLSVSREPSFDTGSLVVAYGGRPSRIAEGTPLVIVPRHRDDFTAPYSPPPPERFSFRLEEDGICFPPLDHAGDAEAIWRDRSGRAIACRVPGRAGEVRLLFDPVAPAHSILSREEEPLGRKDDLNRFKPGSSWMKKHGVLSEPVVDMLGDLLVAAIGESLRDAGAAAVRLRPWPGGESFAVALTHDQDQSIRWRRRLAKHTLQTLIGGPSGRGEALRLATRDVREGAVSPLILSEKMVNREKKLDLRSSFFFLAVDRDRFDRRYNVSSPPFRGFLRKIADDGFTIGLHGGIESYLSTMTLKVEREIVSEAADREIIGVRQHYLRLQVPETWKAQHAAGFSYDASLGFPDDPGFRAGTSFPFRPTGTDSPLVFPLIGMDRALLTGGISTPEEWERWAEPVRRAGGIMNILWHPYAINTDLSDGGEIAYLHLLDWMIGVRKSAWIATLDEIASWWETRRLVTLVESRRDDERTYLRYRFGAPYRSFTLTPLPEKSDIRIEGMSGGEAVISGGRDAGFVSVTNVAAGAELGLSLLPPGNGRMK